MGYDTILTYFKEYNDKYLKEVIFYSLIFCKWCTSALIKDCNWQSYNCINLHQYQNVHINCFRNVNGTNCLSAPLVAFAKCQNVNLDISHLLIFHLDILTTVYLQYYFYHDTQQELWIQEEGMVLTIPSDFDFEQSIIYQTGVNPIRLFHSKTI